jgi:hypothetical protein
MTVGHQCNARRPESILPPARRWLATSLATLDEEVLARFHADADEERTEHVETVRLQLSAIRRMISRLRPGANAGEFR